MLQKIDQFVKDLPDPNQDGRTLGWGALVQTTKLFLEIILGLAFMNYIAIFSATLLRFRGSRSDSNFDCGISWNKFLYWVSIFYAKLRKQCSV